MVKVIFISLNPENLINWFEKLTKKKLKSNYVQNIGCIDYGELGINFTLYTDFESLTDELDEIIEEENINFYREYIFFINPNETLSEIRQTFRELINFLEKSGIKHSFFKFIDPKLKISYPEFQKIYGKSSILIDKSWNLPSPVELIYQHWLIRKSSQTRKYFSL